MAARETVFRVVPGGPVTRTAAPAASGSAPRSEPTPSARQPAPSAPGAAGAQEDLPLTSIARDQMSAIDTMRQAVAKTAAEFETLWRAHAPGRSAPAVDFAKNTVIAMFLGSRPSAGFDVEITRVQREGDAVVVTWAERRPSRDQIAAQVMTAPAHLVSVPRFDGAVRFVKAPGE
jgi:hypothetical protein